MKSSKGISLIVLVITIIVMIVLAGAIVLTLNNSGIMGRASDAVEETNYTTVKELAQMAWAEAYANGAREIEGDHGLKAAVDQALIDNNVDTEKYGINVTTSGVEVENGWIQDGLTVKRGKTVLTIGDDFEYDETGEGTKDVSWKVLGASNKGELLIMSTSDIVSNHKLGNGTDLEEAQNDWLNGAEALDGLCLPYGKGKSATGARSIIIDDIDKITGYDKATYNKDKISEYGNIVTYTYNGTIQPNYSGSNGVSETMTYEHSNGFHFYNGKEFVTITDLTTGIKGTTFTTLKNNCYAYDARSVEMLNTSSEASIMLFGNYDGEKDEFDGSSYWLASPYVRARKSTPTYGMRGVGNGVAGVYGLWDSAGGVFYHGLGVRAVVSLAPDIQVSEAANSGWTY